jgi:hypothetical protein
MLQGLDSPAYEVNNDRRLNVKMDSSMMFNSQFLNLQQRNFVCAEQEC